MSSEQLPAWDNSTEYAALESADYLADLARVKKGCETIRELNQQWLTEPFEQSEAWVKAMQMLSATSQDVQRHLWNLMTYVRCEMSVDSKNEKALKCYSILQQISTEYSTLLKPFEVALTRADQKLIAGYLNSDSTRPEAFHWSEMRKMKDLLLSTSEEMTLAQFSQYGLHSWGDLYDQLSGLIQVEMPSKGTVGLAEASGYLRNSNEQLRQQAWKGIQKGWKTHEVSAASILNNLAGFRHEEYKKRSTKKSVHFLDFPLMSSRIERSTLDSMLGAVEQRVATPRRALKAMAKVLNKSKIDPWDIMAPSPQSGVGHEYSFSEAIEMISSAFSNIDPEMGAFVKMMVEKKWIEARVLPNKKPGAYCTGFPKSSTPRVFQTYMRSYNEVSTLAHEIGHAYHSWVMRDLPLIQQEYPMTLAETASIFGETVLADAILEKADEDTRFKIAWANAQDAMALLINIPARFEFEKSFYEARQNGALTPNELSELTDKAWRKWYGDDISETEKQYWMTKLHFSISGVSFYNFPYTFGYLFSLGIYAKRKELGSGFSKAYVDILRDTGRMTAEDLIQKHLGQDIRKPDFWLASLDIVDQKVSLFESLV